MSRDARLLGLGLVWICGGGLGDTVSLPGRLSAALVLGFSACRRYSPDARFSDDLNGLRCRSRRRSLPSSSRDLREYRWSFGGGAGATWDTSSSEIPGRRPSDDGEFRSCRFDRCSGLILRENFAMIIFGVLHGVVGDYLFVSMTLPAFCTVLTGVVGSVVGRGGELRSVCSGSM